LRTIEMMKMIRISTRYSWSGGEEVGHENLDDKVEVV
jgi:hypothetical protein